MPKKHPAYPPLPPNSAPKKLNDATNSVTYLTIITNPYIPPTQQHYYLKTPPLPFEHLELSLARSLRIFKTGSA